MFVFFLLPLSLLTWGAAIMWPDSGLGEMLSIVGTLANLAILFYIIWLARRGQLVFWPLPISVLLVRAEDPRADGVPAVEEETD